MAQAPLRERRVADELGRADVVVVGAGLAGCAAARLLAEAGEEVLVVERAGIGAGASGRNGGFLFRQPAAWINDLLAEAVAFYTAVEEEGEIPLDLRAWPLLLLAVEEQELARARAYADAVEGVEADLRADDWLADDLAGGFLVDGCFTLDAMSATVAAAEAALRARGEPVPPAIPVSVPVALAERGRSGNAVGVMLVPLPTGEPDPARRLRRIAELTRARKADARSRGSFELTRTRFGVRLFKMSVRHQRLIAMFATNVPGPRHPLALAGAPLERAWPLAAIQGNVRLGVAALSYAGVLGCAVHCDADAVSADVFAAALADEFERIAALA